MYKILIIEDDMLIAGSIEKVLNKWGFAAKHVTDFRDVTAQFAEFDPQLVLLDISLPFYNGYHWCAEIRKLSLVPIIFISSAADNMNIVMAINMGGDDFIAKPFSIDVLTAKVQALLRRSYSMQGQTHLLEHHGAVLNLSNATLTYSGQKLELTKNDFKILQLLMERKGSIVSRDAIMKCLWESDSFVDDNTLTVNIARLRKKLTDAGLDDFIATKKGLGYCVGDGYER